MVDRISLVPPCGGLLERRRQMSKEPKAHKQGRHAGTGQFKSVEWARKNPDRGVVEHVPNPGHGDTGRGKKK